MLSKFKIFKEQQGGNVRLKLSGDFTDMSICDLIDELKNDCHGGQTVYIDTAEINSVSISGFGRDVFSRNLNGLHKATAGILFTGENASDIMPQAFSNAVA